MQKGRCEQISKLPGVSQEDLKNAPNPQAESTFQSAKLHWDELNQPEHAAWLALYRDLLRVRRDRLVPLLGGLAGRCGRYRVLGPGALEVTWHLANSHLQLAANLWHQRREGFNTPEQDLLWTEGEADHHGRLGPWSVRWSVTPG